MTYQSIWYYTDLPEDIITIIEKDLSEKFDDKMEDSKTQGNTLNTDKRTSKNAWVPTTHWVSGFIWHYVMRANRENFLYDLKNIDGESIQYTMYKKGDFYGWHNDAGLSTAYKPQTHSNSHEVLTQNFINQSIESVRKLSFVLQLSDPNEYEGGNLQLINEQGKCYIAPRIRGSMILFDSRTQHRVLKVTNGVRKSLVGWCLGPRWR
jgi:PKHD-type hydroxylase